jgi:ankyrin repeat protein
MDEDHDLCSAVVKAVEVGDCYGVVNAIFSSHSLEEGADLESYREVIVECLQGVSGELEEDVPLVSRAVIHGHPNMVKWLITYGVNPNDQDPDGKSALHHAVLKDLSILKSLLEASQAIAGFTVNTFDCFKKTPLYYIASKYFKSEALDEDALVKIRLLHDHQGEWETVLYGFAFDGDQAGLEWASNWPGFIPQNLYQLSKSLLHYAIQGNQPQMVDFLIVDCISLDSSQWITNQSALWREIAAMDSNHLKVAEGLLKRNVENFNIWIARFGSKINLELPKGAVILNTQDDEYKWTPLHIVAQAGHVELVAFLLQEGADLTITDIDGNTPFDVANLEGRMEVENILFKHQCNLLPPANDIVMSNCSPGLG